MHDAAYNPRAKYKHAGQPGCDFSARQMMAGGRSKHDKNQKGDGPEHEYSLGNP